MSLNSSDKSTIVLISITFAIVLLISIYVSYTRNSVHSFMDKINVENETNEFELNFSEYEEEEGCDYCSGNYTLDEMINKKIEESGLLEILNSQNEIQKPSLSNFPNFNDLDLNSNCTPLFNFTDSVKYSKNYKYLLPNNNTFYVNERLKGTFNNMYIVETISKVPFSSEVYTSYMDTYYNNEGICLYTESSNDMSNDEFNIDCSGNNYEVFLCKEVIDNLIFSGEEKFYVYGKNYDVLVYSNEDNSTIIKYGKNIPVLFYMEKFDNDNKYLRIELLKIEG